MNATLGRINNFPNTLVGRAFKAYFGNDTFTCKNVNHYETRKGSKFDKWCKKRKINAITLGEIILYRHNCLTKERIHHELKHLSQFRKLGILFFPVYGIASLVSYFKKDGWYKGNYFEKKAREHGKKHKNS